MDRDTLKKIAEYIFREKEKPNKLSELELKRIERCVFNNYKSLEGYILKCLIVKETKNGK